ncbi:SKR-1 protein [Aphelenchoides avenae]|nr:SKR-1 protein [Aphelenchus avenae]
MPGDAASSSTVGKVTCKISDQVNVDVDINILRLSHTFDTMYKDLNLDAEINFPGQPDPIIEHDPNTRKRKWFNLNEYEKKFFNVSVAELEVLVMAASYLDIKPLYYYGWQSMAALIKAKSPDEVRALFGLEDDLTEEEKNEIRKQNAWCNY